MNIGDLVKVSIVCTGHGAYAMKESKIAMIIEGPNEVGNIKLLLSNAEIRWAHCSEVEYLPRTRSYLKE